MNINRQPHFLLREPEEFAQQSSGLLWDEQRRALVLAQNQELYLPTSDPAAALNVWTTARPLVVDQFAQQGRIAANGTLLEYNAGRGFLPLVDGELKSVDAPAGTFTDLAVGGDGRMVAGYSNGNDNHGLLLFHLSKRWQVAVNINAEPLCVAVAADNTLWCITSNQLIACKGEPLPHTYQPDGRRFEPETINPHPLAIYRQTQLGVNDVPLALTCADDTIYVLVHHSDNSQSVLVFNDRLNAPPKRFAVDAEIPFAIDIRMVSTNRLALLAPKTSTDPSFRQRDCAIAQLRWQEDTGSGRAQLIRERYPLLSQAEPRFASSADGLVRYQAEVAADSEEAAAGFTVHPRELLPLQRPRYLTAAVATLTQELDSGQVNTDWHRVYLHGCIPPSCKVVLYAKAFNSLEQRTTTPYIQQPDWVWCTQASERGFGRGLVPKKFNQSGLFELLLQRAGGPVRRLQGRYLQLRIQLQSDSRHTPSIHALKIVYPRFSYQEEYLPEHFRQEHDVNPALENEPANGADLRERLFAAFEGMLTPIEENVAAAEVLLSPQHTPEQNLPWLSELFGFPLPEHWPADRRRNWISATGDLQRCRGTLAGVHLALDVVTDGAVGRGQVVVVENFRLRRTMATILGVNMDDEDHPLTLGTGISGNSLVGDSLILAEASAREFLALFSPELADAKEHQVVEDFFNQYANQVSVLLHGEARQLKSVVATTLAEQMPAHVQWRLLETDHPFVLGLAPLLGIDTFVERQPPPRQVTLDDTYIGKEGLLINPAALSPRDVNRLGEM